MKLENLIREALSLESGVELTDATGPGMVDGWDSLGHVAIMSAIDTSYSISIELDDVIRIQSIGDIRSILTEKGVTGF